MFFLHCLRTVAKLLYELKCSFPKLLLELMCICCSKYFRFTILSHELLRTTYPLYNLKILITFSLKWNLLVLEKKNVAWFSAPCKPSQENHGESCNDNTSVHYKDIKFVTLNIEGEWKCLFVNNNTIFLKARYKKATLGNNKDCYSKQMGTVTPVTLSRISKAKEKVNSI